MDEDFSCRDWLEENKDSVFFCYICNVESYGNSEIELHLDIVDEKNMKYATHYLVPLPKKNL